MQKPFTDRVAVVTGAAGGIGDATARELVAGGARVVLSDLNLDGVQRISDELNADGAETIAVRCDVTEFDSVMALAGAAKEAFGPADILVNVAGGSAGSGPAPGWETELDAWHATVAMNLDSVFYGVKAFAGDMVERGYGRIINVASAAGVVGIRGGIAYGSAKAGVIGLAKSLAKDLGGSGVTVNSVSPGPILTPLLEEAFRTNPIAEEGYLSAAGVGRLGTPEEVASLIAYLAGEQSGFITGQNHVIGGLRTLGW